MGETSNEAGADGADTAGEQPAEQAPQTSGADLIEVLEMGAGSLLTLEAMFAKMARIQDSGEAQQSVRSAVTLVRSALEDLRRHADVTPPSQLAFGFVTRQRHS